MSDHFTDDHDIMKIQYKAARAIKAGDERRNKFFICPECSVICDRMDLHGRNAHHWRGDDNYARRAALCKRAQLVSIDLNLSNVICGLMLFVVCYSWYVICDCYFSDPR